MRFYAVDVSRNGLVLTGGHVWPHSPEVHDHLYTSRPSPRGLCRRILLYLLAHEAATARCLWEAVGAPNGSSFGTVCTALSRRAGEWFEGGSRGRQLGGRAVPWRLTLAGRALAGSLERES